VPEPARAGSLPPVVLAVVDAHDGSAPAERDSRSRTWAPACPRRSWTSPLHSSSERPSRLSTARSRGALGGRPRRRGGRRLGRAAGSRGNAPAGPRVESRPGDELGQLRVLCRGTLLPLLVDPPNHFHRRCPSPPAP